jgi:hypothetical protein
LKEKEFGGNLNLDDKKKGNQLYDEDRLKQLSQPKPK